MHCTPAQGDASSGCASLPYLKTQQRDEHQGGPQDEHGTHDVHQGVADGAWCKAPTSKHHAHHEDADRGDEEARFLGKRGDEYRERESVRVGAAQ